MTVQALQEAKTRSDAASAEVQRIHKEVTRLEVAIPKLQLEAAASRQQATDLEHRLAQLSSAAQVRSRSSQPNMFRIRGFPVGRMQQYIECINTGRGWQLQTYMHAR